MKLYYFEDPNGNFGDDLNPWLWSRLLPGVLDDSDREIFVGIGTLLNHRLPAQPVKHVFGSGLGYGDAPSQDGKFVFHAVRGYGTAKALNLPPEKVITDAAVLVRATEFPQSPIKRFRTGFMLTGHSISNHDWETTCAELGFHFISCHWDVDRVLFEMSQCEILLTEAMHGAIVADALRIPWLPVNCYGYVLDFKWMDWLSTMSIDYSPTRISPLYSANTTSGVSQNLKNSVKRGLKACGVWSKNWTDPTHRESTPRERERAMNELLLAARNEPFLSADSLIEAHTDRYLDLVERFKSRIG